MNPETDMATEAGVYGYHPETLKGFTQIFSFRNHYFHQKKKKEKEKKEKEKKKKRKER